MTNSSASRLHAESIVIDAVCPLVMNDARYIDWYREGGLTVIAPTVGGWESARHTLDRLAAWHHLLSERDDVLLVRQSADIDCAKRSGRLGLYFHSQGTD